jgi:hypothetical protein
MEVKRLVKELAFKDGILGKNRTDSQQAKLQVAEGAEFNQSQPKSVKTWKARNHKLASTGNLFKGPNQAPSSHLDFFRNDAQEKPKTDGCHIFKSSKTRLAATNKAKTASGNLDADHNRTRTIKLECKLAKDKADKDTPQRPPPGNFADFERNQRSHSAPQQNCSEEKKPEHYYMAASIAAKPPAEQQRLHLTLKEPSFSHGTFE